MKILYISLLVHGEAGGSIYEDCSRKSTGYAFDRKIEAIEHQASGLQIGHPAGVLVVVDERISNE